MNKVDKHEIENSIRMARQHVNVARRSIEHGVKDLIDYSIRKAEQWIEKAEKYMK